MWRRSGGLGLLTALVAALVLVWSAPAWADPELRLSPAAGATGSEVTVTGTGFDAAAVEIRWGSRSGPVLGTAQGPDFTVTVEVPDSPPNSYPVVAVIAAGNTVTTSNASFQVTPAAEPAVPEPVVTTTTTSPPERVPGTNPALADRTPIDANSRGSGVTGGLDPSLPDTVDRVPDTSGVNSGTNPAGEATRAAADVAAATAAAAGATNPADGAVTTTPLPAGTASADGVSSTDPRGSDAGVSPGRGQRASRASAPAPTSQSSGAVRSPVLLFAGLGMIMAGAAFLAFRNRHRIRA
ncbi:MAG TPA: IPT/TIG domain-containing protein [Acidimicrobiales bacterium]|nr:IPT/TIG domain-containing protein [Acidimicrobiales bacterium]